MSEVSKQHSDLFAAIHNGLTEHANEYGVDPDAMAALRGLEEQYEHEKARADDLEIRMDEEIVAHGRTEEQLEALRRHDEAATQDAVTFRKRMVQLEEAIRHELGVTHGDDTIRRLRSALDAPYPALHPERGESDC